MATSPRNLSLPPPPPFDGNIFFKKQQLKTRKGVAGQRQGVPATYATCSWHSEGLCHSLGPGPDALPAVCLPPCVATPWDSAAGSIPALLSPASSGDLGSWRLCQLLTPRSLPCLPIVLRGTGNPFPGSLAERLPLPVALCGGRGWGDGAGRGRTPLPSCSASGHLSCGCGSSRAQLAADSATWPAPQAALALVWLLPTRVDSGLTPRGGSASCCP